MSNWLNTRYSEDSQVARLSLWKNGKHTNDYKFFDRRISEMFTIGGTGILLHKYLGPTSQGVQLATTAAQGSAGPVITLPDTSAINIGDTVTAQGVPLNSTVIAKDASTITISNNTTSALGMGVMIGISASAAQPSYTNQSEQNIQDLLWMENRDRKYEPNVYKMRGIYQRADQDFDLSQFGLFLATGTMFMTFHLRDMVDMIGRKLMAGDVLELQHLTDYDALNQDVPAALKRYYVVSDGSWPAEGFSPTWWPHLWRVKLNPLVDGQEYKDIINTLIPGTSTTTGQILSTLDLNLQINDAVIAEGVANVPLSGYDTSSLYVVSKDLADQPNKTADDVTDKASDVKDTADEAPANTGTPVQGYLTGSSGAPNGATVQAGIQFPVDPSTNSYFLRTDYLPNRLFQYNGKMWIAINDAVRTSLTQGSNNQTLLGGFVNDSNTFVNNDGATVNERQSLSTALTPKADN